MKLVGISVALALAVVLGFACLVQAAPLDLKQVAADAKWLVHVDVDAIRASTVVQKGWDKCMAMDKNAEKHLDMLRDHIGMDLRTDLHGMTFYGKEVGKETGVLIVHAKADQHKLLEMAKMAPEYKVVKSGLLEIHTWTHKHGKMTVTVAGAFVKPDVMVFASCPEELKAALAVLAGKCTASAPIRPWRARSCRAARSSPALSRYRPGQVALQVAAGHADRVGPHRHGREQRRVVLPRQGQHDQHRGRRPNQDDH